MLRTDRVEGWFVQATNRSPISASGLHLLIAALRSFYTVMQRGVFDLQDQRYHPLVAPDIARIPSAAGSFLTASESATRADGLAHGYAAAALLGALLMTAGAPRGSGRFAVGVG